MVWVRVRLRLRLGFSTESCSSAIRSFLLQDLFVRAEGSGTRYWRHFFMETNSICSREEVHTRFSKIRQVVDQYLLLISAPESKRKQIWLPFLSSSRKCHFCRTTALCRSEVGGRHFTTRNCPLFIWRSFPRSAETAASRAGSVTKLPVKPGFPWQQPTWIFHESSFKDYETTDHNILKQFMLRNIWKDINNLS